MSRNILFIFNNYPGLGGVESVSNNIINYLGAKNSIYTLSIASQMETPHPECIKEHYTFDSTKNSKKCAQLLNRIIKTHNIDCIINQGIYPIISKILFHPTRKYRPEIFSFLHGMPKYEEQQCLQLMSSATPAKQRKWAILNFLRIDNKFKRYTKAFATSYTQAFTHSDKIVLLCNDYIKQFKEAYNLCDPSNKIIAIENPLNTLNTAQNHEERHLKENKILYVGRLADEKQVHLILDVWSHAQHLTDWELVIIGDGPCREQLQKQIITNNIKRVTFTGQLNSVDEHYRQSKIIMLASRHEGFAMCLSEAQRFGVVPLAFNTSAGVNSVVADAGILVEQNNTHEMIQALLQLINNPSELETLSKRAKKNAARFDITRIGEQWDKLLTTKN